MTVFKQRRFSAKCNECKRRFDFRVGRATEGYTKEQIEYFKLKFVCKICKPDTEMKP